MVCLFLKIMTSICIIGAGAGGLVTASKLSEKQLTVTVFEQSSEVGGVWNYTQTFASQDKSIKTNASTSTDAFFSIEESTESAVYPTLRTNLPSALMVNTF
jgi:cation diffusion facilitator CzcD-associated flavoprotein CzcO